MRGKVGRKAEKEPLTIKGNGFKAPKSSICLRVSQELKMKLNSTSRNWRVAPSCLS